MAPKAGVTREFAASASPQRRQTDRGPKLQNVFDVIELMFLPPSLSTMLAFVLLANSKSYVFITFFKVFFMVVTFGLFQVT